jgi:hypothetical protein
MGEWRHAETGYLKANRTYCDLCGQLIPGRYWVAEDEEKYVTYWIPRHGSAGASRG